MHCEIPRDRGSTRGIGRVWGIDMGMGMGMGMGTGMGMTNCMIRARIKTKTRAKTKAKAFAMARAMAMPHWFCALRYAHVKSVGNPSASLSFIETFKP